MKKDKVSNSRFKWLTDNLLAFLWISVFVGLSSAVFLIGLYIFTDLRVHHMWLYFLLPVGGAIMTYIYSKHGHIERGGNNLVLDSINKGVTLRLRIAPLVMIGTWVTHLFGGSAGREGTALQIGAGVGSYLKRWITEIKYSTLVKMGVAAGFASVFGTPLAGIIFAIEFIHKKKLNLTREWHLIPVAFGADWVTQKFAALVYDKPLHSHHHIDDVWSQIDLPMIGYICIAGVFFGVAAWLFSFFIEKFKQGFNKITNKEWLHSFIGGGILLLAFWALGFSEDEGLRFAGLGLPVIAESFTQNLTDFDWILKLLFTSFTLAALFKGGEVTPLFFIGAALGNVLAQYFDVDISILAALGFVSVFGAAARTPFATAVMAAELFGWEIGLLAIIPTQIAYYTSRSRGIYEAQL